LRARGAIDERPRRSQDRTQPEPAHAAAAFDNEPDTDFALAHNRAWIDAIVARWQARETFDVPLQIAGAFRFAERRVDGFDPSRPGKVPYRFAIATHDDIERALAAALTGAEAWSRVDADSRADV